MRFFGFLRKAHMQTLIVMRTADMRLVHPQTDFSHKCSLCAAEVGIYPSGQKLIRKLGKRQVRIVCNQCVSPSVTLTAQPAPGAMGEVGESVRREP